MHPANLPFTQPTPHTSLTLPTHLARLPLPPPHTPLPPDRHVHHPIPTPSPVSTHHRRTPPAPASNNSSRACWRLNT
ncbi:hypothetical protein IQ07DRAFT_581643 [Pyrenochaeta sp. DS3sAY3a]|nr:hypothetical protein IQ07DRAFT_581643 [Pyrenochaeta sp. DS3sAY3a]